MFFTQVRFAALLTSCPGRGEKQVVPVLLLQNLYFKPNLNINVCWTVRAYCPNSSLGSFPPVHVRQFKLVLTYISCYITNCIGTKEKSANEVPKSKKIIIKKLNKMPLMYAIRIYMFWWPKCLVSYPQWMVLFCASCFKYGPKIFCQQNR